jgi:phosphonate transport system substrate-binding protein
MRVFVLWVFWFYLASVAADDKVYTFGVSPQKSATQLAKTWSPILAYLSEESGVSLRFATAQSSADFSRLLAEGNYDFCYVNPQQYVYLHDKVGYIAFAHEKDKFLQGILVVNADSPIQNLSELNAMDLAFPSPTSFGASVLIQAELKRQGLSFNPNYVKSHDSVYLNVAREQFIAGGGVRKTFNLLSSDIKEQLRILMETKAYTPHAMAYHPSVPEEVRQKVLDAMLTLNTDPVGRQMLNVIGFKGIAAATDDEYDEIRSLQLSVDEH